MRRKGTHYVHAAVFLPYTKYKQNPNQAILKKALRLEGTHYVCATKCLPDTKYKQNPNQTILNKALRCKGTHYVHTTRCLPDTMYKQNPKQRLLDGVLGLKWRPNDTLCVPKGIESFRAVVLDVHGSLLAIMTIIIIIIIISKFLAQDNDFPAF